jgi:sensor domain CHASE-containing protein
VAKHSTNENKRKYMDSIILAAAALVVVVVVVVMMMMIKTAPISTL